MNIEELHAIALSLLRRSDAHAREMHIDKALAVVLDAKYGSVTRQHHVEFCDSQRPSRIDFRIGGTNPVLIELAVRPRSGVSELYGSQNKDELQKLTRATQSRAKLRALLLIDLAESTIPMKNLRQTYDVISVGAGRFERHSVRVLYVHDQGQYNFVWRP